MTVLTRGDKLDVLSFGSKEVEMLSVEEFKSVLPKTLRVGVADGLMKEVNALFDDPAMQQSFRENLLSYTQVLSMGKFGVLEYAQAIKFVSLRLVGSSIFDAYSRTFPDRVARMKALGTPTKDMHSAASAYGKTKLVTLLLQQAIVPSWLLNQDLYQKALNVQADLMLNAKSEKVRTDAASALMLALKVPEVAKMQLDVNVKEDSSIEALREATMELVKKQREALEARVVNAVDVAHSRIQGAESYGE